MTRRPVKFALLLAGLLTLGGAAAQPADAPLSAGGADTCAACHREPSILAVFDGPHGVAGDPRTPLAGLQCEACHGPGGRHPAGGESSIVRFGPDAEPGPQNDACLGCHRAEVGGGWPTSAHHAEDLACAACHRSHARADPVLETAAQPGICYDCHLRERGQMMQPYAHPVRQGRMDCSACHAPHGAPAEAALRRPTLNETCYECHAEKRGPFAFEHAPVSEDCSTCHAPHGSAHPGLLTRRAPLLCQQCHSQAGHPSLPFGPGGLPGGAPSSALLAGGCLNCHAQVHGSNHPSGITQMR